MDGLYHVTSVALQLGKGVAQLLPAGLEQFVAESTPGAGSLLVIGDDQDPEQDTSTGPAGFKASDLVLAFKDAEAVVCSAVIPHGLGPLIAARLAASTARRFVIVISQPQHHDAWTVEAVKCSGRDPVLHVMVHDAVPAGFPGGARVVH